MSFSLGRLAGLGLAAAWLCTSAPAAVAQDASPPSAVRALGVTLPGPDEKVVHWLMVRFSEPMVAEAGGHPEALAFLHLTPSVPVLFEWVDTDLLQLRPGPGGFPAGPLTVRVDTSARAVSGAQPLRDVTVTVTVAPPAATMEGRRRADGRVVLVIRPDRALGPQQVRAFLADVHYQPYMLKPPALGPAARRELARRDPRRLARFDAAARQAIASAGLTGRVAVRPVVDRRVDGLAVSANDLVVETVGVPPPDVHLVVGAPSAAATPPPVPKRWQSPPPPGRIVRLHDTLRLTSPICGAGCTADTTGIEASLPVNPRALQRALRVVDVTDPAAERVVPLHPGPIGPYENDYFPLAALGYGDLRSGRRYILSVDALTAGDGQPLAAPWFEVLTPALREAVATVGNRRDAVWEATLGPRLPIVTRSLGDVVAGAAPIPPDRLSATLNAIGEGGVWRGAPSGPVSTIPTAATDDAVRAPLVDATDALAPNGRGFAWLMARPGTELPRPAGDVITVHPPSMLPEGVLVQVTNLGVTVRTFGDSLLVFVTALDTGKPVADAAVTILDTQGTHLWRGTTDADGVARTDAGGAALATGVPSLVLVEHDGDRAFGEPIAGWGVAPWLGPSRSEAIEGVVLTDRGVYRPGDTVRVKAILRRREADRLMPLADGTPLVLTLDRGPTRVASIDGRVAAGGGVEWTVPIATDAELSGGYVLTVHAGTPQPPAPPWARALRLATRIAVKDVRPLEFEVDATVARGPRGGTPAEPRGTLDLRIAARDLTGVPLRSGRVAWTLTHVSATPFSVPAAYEGFEVDPQWTGSDDDPLTGEGRLEDGVLTTRVEVPDGVEGFGYFTLEAEVVDGDSAQSVATRVIAILHPDAYLAVKAAATPRASVRVVALDAKGEPVPGVAVRLIARSQEPEGQPLPPVRVVTAAEPLEVPLPGLEGSNAWSVEAESDDDVRAVASVSAGAQIPTPGLVPSEAPIAITFDKPRYAIGDRATVTVRAPWAAGTALVTVERHRLVSHHVLPLRGEPLTLDVPIDDAAAGGLVVSAIAIKGRTAACCDAGNADPGAPAIAEADERLAIDPASYRLHVAVDALTAKPAPGAPMRWRVGVTEADGRPARADVTLWAVDEAWLRLTDFQLPDITTQILERELPSVATWDSRRALLRRTIPEPLGQIVNTVSAERSSEVTEVDGQGQSRVRADRRPLAFWLGDLRTGPDGTVTVDAPPLPETLTTFRVFAVAATEARFGQSSSPLVVASPVMARPVVPRFLTRGDRATIPVTVASLQDAPARARLVVESLTPELLAVDGEPPAIVLEPAQRRTVTIGVRAMKAGTARLRVRVVTPDGADAVEHVVPILAPVIVERTAISGPIDGSAVATLPVRRTGVDAEGGGLSITLSASLLAGAALAGKDLETYAYLCLEQRTSRMLALALAAKEGGPFAFSPANEAGPVPALQRALREVASFRCSDGKGYGLWNGACEVSSPYLSAYLLYALQTIRGMEIEGVRIDEADIDRAASAVEAALEAPAAATAQGHLSDGWAAFGLKVLADEGRYPARAGAAVLARRHELPLWAVAHLYDALLRADPGRPERRDLEQRLVDAVAPDVIARALAAEAAASHGGDWAWPSEPKTLAIVLDVLARHGKVTREQARALATSLMHLRRADGGWVSTQANAWALVALATYRHEFEDDDDPVQVTADLAGTRLAATELCEAHDPATLDVPMRDLLARLGPSVQASLAFTATGERPAFFTARLDVHRPAQDQPAVSHGMAVSRVYEVRTGDTWTPVTMVTAGDLVRVTLTVTADEGRYFVALSDPLPAGFEAVDPELASTAASRRGDGLTPAWSQAFDHVQRRDARVDAFATALPSHTSTFEYTARATTVGTFFAAPPRIELMYEPEVYGRGVGATITVKPAP